MPPKQQQSRHRENFAEVSLAVGAANRSFAIQSPPPHLANGRVLFLFHGYTFTPSRFLRQFNKLRINDGFTLVAPAGYGGSFNGVVCCGAALAKKVDDVALVKQIYRHLAQYGERDGLLPENTNIRERGVYLVGRSNGAFLASKIALQAVNGDEELDFVRGVVLISGYQYDKELYFPRDSSSSSLASRSSPPSRTLSMMQVHSRADTVVGINGCCNTDETRSCCCGISAKSMVCLPASSAYDYWLQLDGCGTTTGEGAARARDERVRRYWNGFDNVTLFAPAINTCEGGAVVRYYEFETLKHTMSEEVEREIVEFVSDVEDARARLDEAAGRPPTPSLHLPRSGVVTAASLKDMVRGKGSRGNRNRDPAGGATEIASVPSLSPSQPVASPSPPQDSFDVVLAFCILFVVGFILMGKRYQDRAKHHYVSVPVHPPSS